MKPGHCWGIEHHRADGLVVGEVATFPHEEIARGRLAVCHDAGLPCVLVRCEVGPWLPVVPDEATT